MTDDYTNPEIARALVRIEKGQEDLGKKFDALTEKFVTVDVFDLRLATVERDIEDGRKKAEAAQAAADSRRPSALTIAVSICAIVASIAALMPYIPNK